MAINLASKYSGKIAEKFYKESYVAGRANQDYDFVGVKTVKIYTPQTVDLNNYDRTATANRFGTPTEMQDTVQELQLTQDKGFSITIDRGNNDDQMNTKGAAKMMKLQIREKVVPFMDKYALGKWANNAGTIEGLSSAPTKTTIANAILTGLTVLDNGLVPDADRTVYIGASMYNLLRQADEFYKADELAVKAISKGMVGMIGNAQVVKVPDSYMPDGCYFLIVYKNSVMHPNKIKTMRILDNVAGIDGNVLEGRNYFDAFVIGAKCEGVYAAFASANVVAAPSVSISSHSATVTSASGVTFYYTLDGTDPRYSESARTYSSPVTTVSGRTIKVAGNKDGRWSAVTEKTDE